MKVKLCGTANLTDALIASGAGADYVGIVVHHQFSERIVEIPKAAEIAKSCPTPIICLFFDASDAFINEAVNSIRPFGLQLMGNESPSRIENLRRNLKVQVWKSLFLPAENQAKSNLNLLKSLKSQAKDYINLGVDAILIDAVDLSGKNPRYGGTGKRVNWDMASELIQDMNFPIFLAGGIEPNNVEEAITKVKPYGIDLCSGVESEKGKRDPKKVKILMEKIEQLK